MKLVKPAALAFIIAAFFASCEKDNVVESPVDFNSTALPMTRRTGSTGGNNNRIRNY
ncbi:MAG: hypothetical protein WDO19_25945 [Bacteroidota bacterium]